MNIFSGIVAFSIIINFFLIGHLFALDLKNKVLFSYLLLIISMIIWEIGDLLLWTINDNTFLFKIVIRVLIISWFLICFMFFNFIYKLINKNNDIFYYIYFVMFCILTIAIIINPYLIIEEFIKVSWGRLSIPNFLYFPLIFSFILFPMCYSFTILISYYFYIDNRVKKKNFLFLITIFSIILLLTISNNIIISAIFKIDKIPALASAYSVIFSLFTFIGITKYNILSLNIRDLSYDLFSYMTDIVIITDSIGNIIRLNNNAETFIKKLFTDEIKTIYQLFPKTYSFSSLYFEENFELTLKDTKQYLQVTQKKLHKSGIFSGNMLIIKNITSQKETELKLIESEKIYQLFAENTTDIIFIISKSFEIIYANPIAYKNILPENKNNLLFTDLFNNTDKNNIINKLEKIRKNKSKSVEIKSKLYVNNKNSIFVKITCNYFINSDNKTGYIIIIRNDNERQALNEIIEKNTKFGDSIMKVKNGVISIDNDGCIVMINEEAEKTTEWSSKEAIGKNLFEVFSIYYEQNNERLIQNSVDLFIQNKNKDIGNKSILISKNGKEIPIIHSISPIQDKSGTSIGMVINFKDMTEQKKVEEDMLRMERLESLGMLAGGIAHDFNNLLTAIQGNIDLAQIISNSPDISEYLSEANKATKRARDLTEQFITFAKGGNPIKTKGSIAEILKEVSTFLLTGSNIELEIEIPDNLYPVEFDAPQISRVLQNLFNNAIESTETGGRIIIEANNISVNQNYELPVPFGNYILISITDFGKGISDEIKNRVFDPYFTTKPGKQGLGLSSVYSIIKKHGGYITLKSQIDQGTTFYIYLPAQSDHTTSFNNEGEKKMKREIKKIFIMDDEEQLSLVAKEMLNYLGYKSDYATNGNDTLVAIQNAIENNDPYDLVILDLTIPGGPGGKEINNKIKEIDSNIISIVASGYTDDKVIENYKDFKFDGVLNKPYDMGSLKELFNNL